MEQIVRGAVTSIVLAALGAVVMATVDLAGLVGQPFAGFVFLENGDVGPRLMTAAEAGPEVARLRPQDRVVGVDGIVVRSGPEARAEIAKAAPGTPLRYTILRSGRESFEIVVPTVRFTWPMAARLFGPFLVGGLLLVALTGFVLTVRPGDAAARGLFAIAASLGTTFGVLMVDALLAYRLDPTIELLGLAAAKASVLHMAFLWPDRRRPLDRWPLLAPGLVYAAMVLHALVFRVYYFDHPRFTTLLSHVSVGTFVFALVMLVANFARSALGSP